MCTQWHVSPQRFASGSASQKLRRDTVPLPRFLGHTNRSVKLSHESQHEIALFRHFQDQFLTSNKEKWGKKTDLCFARFVFLTFRGPLASHDSNPYPNRSRIARYNATKTLCALASPSTDYERSLKGSLNRRGTKIRVFRVCFRASFLRESHLACDKTKARFTKSEP